MVTIRKFSRERLTMDDLLTQYKSISQPMAEFLQACVFIRKNILISGGTGSGKTTLLNILSSFIPDGERIITIEDAAELRLKQSHWARLESRPPNIEGKGAITVRDLFVNCLRMRPDRIIIGECRGPEVQDMLQAMNTGHDGSLTTIHANSTHDAITRLDSMILMSGLELPIRAIRESIASAIQVIVHISRLSDGSRKVVQVTEIAGMQDETHINLKDIFVFAQTGVDKDGKVIGEFRGTGYIPSFLNELKTHGIPISEEIFKR
jgi:Flp pilus assembly protein, ATPase CpaF